MWTPEGEGEEGGEVNIFEKNNLLITVYKKNNLSINVSKKITA